MRMNIIKENWRLITLTASITTLTFTIAVVCFIAGKNFGEKEKDYSNVPQVSFQKNSEPKNESLKKSNEIIEIGSSAELEAKSLINSTKIEDTTDDYDSFTSIPIEDLESYENISLPNPIIVASTPIPLTSEKVESTKPLLTPDPSVESTSNPTISSSIDSNRTYNTSNSRTSSYPTTPTWNYPSTPTYIPQTNYSNPNSEYVRGYVRRNGTVVAPYYRSRRDNTTLNNWSTKGNINPYTGRRGTRRP